jgi:hypothetical protein
MKLETTYYINGNVMVFKEEEEEDLDLMEENVIIQQKTGPIPR